MCVCYHFYHQAENKKVYKSYKGYYDNKIQPHCLIFTQWWFGRKITTDNCKQTVKTVADSAIVYTKWENVIF